jgi:hypothetical protein
MPLTPAPYVYDIAGFFTQRGFVYSFTDGQVKISNDNDSYRLWEDTIGTTRSRETKVEYSSDKWIIWTTDDLKMHLMLRTGSICNRTEKVNFGYECVSCTTAAEIQERKD